MVKTDRRTNGQAYIQDNRIKHSCGILDNNIFHTILGCLTKQCNNQLSKYSITNRLDPYGIAADCISAVMSAPVVSYFFAPVFTLMEEELKARVQSLCCWPEGDGIFCPGDAFSNLMALRMALHHFFPQVRESGFSTLPSRPAFFVSEDACSDWENAAAITGKLK